MTAPSSSPAPAVVLVTGASRGLGRGIALELARGGYSIAVNYVANRAAADETIELCRAAAPDARQCFRAVQADVAVQADRARMVAEVLREFGQLDALVNNAGIAPKERADLTEATEASFEELIRTNLQGPYFLTQTVARHWLTNKPPTSLPGGHKIIFVTSVSANTASVNRGDYCISKAGLAMAAQLWATRLAAHDVQVVELRPGIMSTDMTAGVKQKYDALMQSGLVPQQRWGEASDVGLAVRAVVSGQFPFSTGAVIPIDGGLQLRRF